MDGVYQTRNDEVRVRLAPLYKRLLAAVLDFLIFTLCFVVGVTALLVLILAVMAIVVPAYLGLGFDLQQFYYVLFAVAVSVLLLSNWLYYALGESSEHQATLGKRICGLRVTDCMAQTLTFAQASGRYAAKYLSAACLLIGYFIALFTENKQTMHDLLAKTIVVERTEAFDQPQRPRASNWQYQPPEGV